MPSSTCQLLLMFNHILSLPIVNQISLNLIQQSDLTNSKIFLSQNFSNAVNRRILPWDWTQTPINGHQHWEGDHQSGRCELENHCENQSLHTDTCIGPVDMAIHVSPCNFLVKFCEQYGGILLDKPHGRTCWCENLRERGNFPCGGNKKDWRLLWGVIARTQNALSGEGGEGVVWAEGGGDVEGEGKQFYTLCSVRRRRRRRCKSGKIFIVGLSAQNINGSFSMDSVYLTFQWIIPPRRATLNVKISFEWAHGQHRKAANRLLVKLPICTLINLGQMEPNWEANAESRSQNNDNRPFGF